MNSFWDLAVAQLLDGGLVVYPTETFYALGCLATLDRAVERIFSVKGRSSNKPLPLIVSDWTMAHAHLRFSEAEQKLARKFWPGSLSIILASTGISALARDADGLSAVRMCPHPLARRLCSLAGGPLVSSSANLSGELPVSDPGVLDSLLLEKAQALVLDEHPWPAGGLPSTLVRMLDDGTLLVVREGAVSTGDLAAVGYEVRVADTCGVKDIESGLTAGKG